MSEEVPLEATPSDKGPFPIDIYEPAGYVLPRGYRSLYEQVLDLPIRDDDVFIITHPKCGTTWTGEMVWLLRHKLDFKGAEEQVDVRMPLLEASSLLFTILGEKKVEKHINFFSMKDRNTVQCFAEWPKSEGPRIVKTHLQWGLLPRELRRPDCKAKIIYVAREAKDVCVSFYHHSKMLYHYSGSFEEFAEHFISDSLFFAPFWKHVLEFWTLRDRQNVLFLKYEDMKKDLSSVIRKTNEFLNMPPLSDEQLEKLKNYLSFETMKRNDAVNYTGLIKSVKSGKSDQEEGNLVRKGIVGDWKEKMSPDLARRFDEWTAEQTRDSGLTF